MKINKYQNGDTIQGDKYRREGVQALQYQEAERARRHAEWLSRLEMRPVVVKKATLKEKMQGKKDETKLVPHVVGMSGTDPIGEFIVGGIGLGKAMEGAYLVGKYAFNQGRKAILSRAIDKAISKGVQGQEEIVPGLVGWAPKQTFKGYHASNEAEFVPNFFHKGWAQETHNAPYGVYIANGNRPGYGFLTKRPYVHQVETTFEKPQVQLGEVKGKTKNGTRNKIERQAQAQGADGIIYKGIADNLMENQFIAKTLNPDTKVAVQGINKSEGLWTDWAQDMLNDPDKLSEFIDELKGTLAGLKMDNLKYPGFFDSHIAKVTLEIENLENIYKQISTAPVVRDLKKVLHDFYPQLTNNKYTTLTPGPYVEKNVAGELIYPIGTIKPGAYADYRMEKMMDLLRERGIQPSESGFWKVTEGGPKAVGTIGGQVRELTHKPATLYTTRHSTNVQGFEVPSTGKSYVRVRNNSNMDEVHSTNTHEVIGHGTEIFINDVTKGVAMNEYKAVTDLVKAHGKFKTADSIKPGELRSTLLEVHNALVNEVKRFVHGSVKQTEAIIKDRVGKMSVQEFMKRLESTNSYGKDYAAFIADNPQTVNLFKKLLTDGLSVAAPVGLTGYGFANWLKKGGKTHKPSQRSVNRPWGHRSILDNGWQSTKLLKNKKNVYGKSKS